jgi:hypothetical protein
MTRTEERRKKMTNVPKAQRLLALCVVSLLLVPAFAQEKLTQRGFDSPQAAADALVTAAGSYQPNILLEILGPGSRDLVLSSDPIENQNQAAKFAAKAREKESIELSPNKKLATMLVGNEEWPLPIPIVLKKGKWYFDTKQGRAAILARRIGANELDVITICHNYVAAQHEYAMQRHDGDTFHQYAQRIISTPGKQDGLVWRNPDGTLSGPISEGIAKALAQGYSDKSEPFHGYYFKILKGQGPAAPLGQLDFLVKDVMIGGFALVAAPAQYRVTGVKTFIVSHNGIVYEKDLGSDTLTLFQAMSRYNPDKTWTATNDGWPEPPVVRPQESAQEEKD